MNGNSEINHSSVIPNVLTIVRVRKLLKWFGHVNRQTGTLTKDTPQTIVTVDKSKKRKTGIPTPLIGLGWPWQMLDTGRQNLTGEWDREWCKLRQNGSRIINALITGTGPALNIKLLELLTQGASRSEKYCPPPKSTGPQFFSNDVSLSIPDKINVKCDYNPLHRSRRFTNQ